MLQRRELTQKTKKMPGIDKKNIEDVISLTPMQEGMLVHYLTEPGSRVYFEQLSLGLTGPIEVKYFEQAWNDAIAGNEMLRTFFRWEKLDKPVQVILKEYRIKPIYYDLVANGAREDKGKQVEKIELEDRGKNFDLRQIPFRLILCKLEENKYHLIISYHHILFDGWSTGIILNEFFSIYDACKKQAAVPYQRLFPLKAKFKDFVQWHHRSDPGEQKEFWENYLKGFDTQKGLPVRQGRINKTPGGTAGEVRCCGFVLPGEITDKFARLLMEKRLSQAVFFYCVWGILLQNYCDTDDVVFGAAVSGRSVPIQGIENTVGLFINTLPLRVKAEVGEKVMDLFSRVNRFLPSWEKYEGTPLIDIKRYSGLGTGEELFDSLVVIENYPLESRLKPGGGALIVHSYSMWESTDYDVALRISLLGEVGVDMIYHSSSWHVEVIEGLLNHFRNIVEDIVENPGKAVRELQMLSTAEKKQLLEDFNDTGPGFPQDKTLQQLFARQVEQTPDHIALVGKEEGWKGGRVEGEMDTGGYLSYRELNEKSDGLAFWLVEKGVQPGTIAAIMVGRYIEMIIGILGILKAGCAYLPLDPGNPANRVQYLLNDSGVGVLAATSALSGQLEELKIVNGRLSIIHFPPQTSRTSAAKRDHQPLLPGVNAPAASLAYIIYTSGSTGRPKGVPVTHANLSPLLHWGYKYLGIDSTDRVVQNLSYYFDWSVWEIFITLTSGAGLYMAAEEILLDAGRYVDFINRNGITVLHITPTHFQVMIQGERKLSTLKYLCIGAEKLIFDLVTRSYKLVETGCRIFNMYGPTEATIMAAVLEIDRAGCRFYKGLSSVPIGRALGNTALLILDRNLKPCPLYVTGELYIAGDGNAMGYLNHPELTCEKFDHDLWDYRDKNEKLLRGVKKREAGKLGSWEAEKTNDILPRQGTVETSPNEKLLRGVQGGGFLEKSPPGCRRQKIYKTGDQCRWLPDGTIEFLGRFDHQVKIRGFRIELGEIENELSGCPGVKEVLVIARQYHSGESYLCAYVVLQSTCPVHSLKEYLSDRLPDYMVPSYYVVLEKIPLNPNGKVDTRALPVPSLGPGKEKTRPRGSVEKKLADIWARVLDIDKDQLGVDDDFFEAGGHSLTISRLIGLIYKELGTGVPFTEIFIKPTIRELAEYISRKEESPYGGIPLVEEKEYYALSSAQQRLYVLQQADVRRIDYNIHESMLLQGSADKGRFQEVFQRLIARHESLRTSFIMVADKPVQKIHRADEVEFAIEYYDLQVTGTGAGDRCRREFVRPFDLSQAPLLRVGLAALEKQEHHLLMVDMHHIISDGTSMGVMVNEFMAAYLGKELRESRVRYKDFAEWSNGETEKKRIKQQEEYWLGQLAGEIPLLNLPMDFTRPAVWSFAGDHMKFQIGPGDTRALKSFSLEANATLYGVLAAGFYILLSKLSGQEDIIIGTPVVGRRHADLHQVIGMFVNTLALRHFPYGDKTAGNFVREVRDKTREAFENQEYPFEDLVEKLKCRRDVSRNPLFDVMFVMQNLDIPEVRIPGLNLKLYPFEDHIAKFDLLFICEKVGENLLFTVEYCTKIFRKAAVKKFINYFKRIISQVVRQKDIRIGEIDIISREERRKILYTFNNFEPGYVREATIPQLFAGQVERVPDHIAVKGVGIEGCGTALTYRELNKRSAQLACFLIHRGMVPGELVGIMVERSVEMIIGILGILMAGCAYLPLNPRAPAARNDYILGDTRAKMLLNGTGEWRGVARQNSPVQLGSLARPDQLCYIIYTSGSTGKPKGVPITHSNLSPLLHWGYRHLGINTRDAGLQNLAYYFDWSVLEIFIMLTSGASLHEVTEEVLLDPAAGVEYINTHALTVLHVTPTQYRYMISTPARPHTLKYLFIGAEKLTYDLLKRSFASVSETCRVFNMYGPTETTVISAVLEIDREDHERFGCLTSVPIGRPTGNIDLFILDNYLKMCPVNIPGELYIGGDGVAQGYLNNPILTAEKFIKKVEAEKPLNRSYFYKTGDLSRWLADGNVEYLGRIDQQVKIRGFRIEPGEIEAQLLSHENIKEAVVLVRARKDGEKYLCAYIVPGGSWGFDPPAVIKSGLKKYLSRRLPDYMVPSYLVRLETLPRNPNGKIDIKQLPSPRDAEAGGPGEYMPAQTGIEKKMVRIWQQVLVVDRVGLNDDFFESGGHSLRVLQLVNAIHKEFHIKLNFQDVFQHSTAADLCHLVETLNPSDYEEIKPLPQMEYYQLSYTQKRLWLLSRLEPGNPTFNISAALPLSEPVAEGVIRQVFQALTDRHESFRTTFQEVHDHPVQVIHPRIELDLKTIDLSGLDEKNPGPKKKRWLEQECLTPFDPAVPPLFKIRLIRYDKGSSELLLIVHHLIVDGWSIDVLEKEFHQLYEIYKRGGRCDWQPLKIQYKDYAAWSNRVLADEQKMAAAKKFWKELLGGPLPRLNLPYDYGINRLKPNNKESSGYCLVIAEDIARALKSTAGSCKASLFMILLAGFNLLLARLSGQNDIMLGFPAANRQHEDLKGLVGLFVNSLVLRNRVDPGESFIAFLERVQKDTLHVLEYQSYPLELICGELGIQFPDIPVFFNMLNTGAAHGQFLEHHGPIHTPEVQTAKFPITCYLTEYKNGILVEVHYFRRLFKPAAIETIMQLYRTILENISREPGQAIGKYNFSKKRRKLQGLQLIKDEE
jgi:amino acid adenylation domain-containing protein